jgi:hypothetical protein
MQRASTFAGMCVAGLVVGGPAYATGHASAAAAASAKIVEPGGIQVISPMILPTVIAVSPSSAAFAGEVPSAGPGGALYARNAQLMIRSEAGEALSMTVPASFTVVRLGGSEALTVTTNTFAEYGLSGDGILMAGGMMNGTATSLDIGGKLALASAPQLVPGPYEGLFVVVVEYN